VLTSGGDAPGMNAAVRSVVRTAIKSGLEVYGIRRGYHGLMEGDISSMEFRSVADILQRGGTILKTARSEEFKTEEGRKRALLQMRRFFLDALVVIGGDGSFRGAIELDKIGVPVIGIPGSIDNDIGCTDYSIGFDTAANTVVDAINKIRDTASSHERTYVIEVMGRHSGHIAVSAGLASGAEAVLIPEYKPDMEALCERVVDTQRRGKAHCIIIVAEGLFAETDNAIPHEGSALKVGRIITETTGIETRITILGHLQRGGAPTVFDRTIATLMGAKAIELLISGESGMMVGYVNNKPSFCPLELAIQSRKPIDQELLALSDLLAGF
ncbi:MAG TPA: 6-phosphofructokinase, partial [Firmicutes bacterium]|nr:6-phosphofructokinase [Bacillota bacterium]